MFYILLYCRKRLKNPNSYFGRGEPYHDSFFAYMEFMQDHLGQLGTACYGPSGGMYDPGTIIVVGSFVMFIILLCFIWFRNPQFYWFRPDHGKRSFITCGWWIGARGDPYDMSRVYEEFAVRAMIGQEMADKESKDKAHKGYVDPHVGSKYDLMGENGQFSVKHEEANFCAEIEEIEDETNRCT